MKRITIGILTYNHEAFIEKCLRSVLALEYDNLEIIVSDDCSKDNTFNIVKDIVLKSQSSHKVILNKNEINVGLAENFNKIFYELATGQFMMTLGGDDIIKENYLEYAVSCFEKDTKVMMLDFNGDIIDEFDNVQGIASNIDFETKSFELKNYLELIPIRSFAPGRIFRKNLISEFETISKKCPTEDSVLVLRALLKGKLMRINKSFLYYRRHANNISSNTNLKKISNAQIISQYLKDVIYAQNNQVISEERFVQLFKRINYEYEKREILYSNINNQIKKIRLQIIKFIYNSSL